MDVNTTAPTSANPTRGAISRQMRDPINSASQASRKKVSTNGLA